MLTAVAFFFSPVAWLLHLLLPLATQYVREEFKAHKDVPPAQADAFMKTWQEYWVHLARSRVCHVGLRVSFAFRRKAAQSWSAGCGGEPSL